MTKGKKLITNFLRHISTHNLIQRQNRCTITTKKPPICIMNIQYTLSTIWVSITENERLIWCKVLKQDITQVWFLNNAIYPIIMNIDSI